MDYLKVEFLYHLRSGSFESVRLIHWDDPTYDRLLNNRTVYYATTGWSEIDWSALRFIDELLNVIRMPFSTVEAHLIFIGDFTDLMIKGCLPKYALPILASEIRTLSVAAENQKDEDLIERVANISRRVLSAFDDFFALENRGLKGD